MPQFLNKSNLLEWLPKLIETSETELIIISPYIQISQKIFSLLKDAENRGVQITLVYKEGELSNKERKKIDEINNLNLLFHQNLHSKCLYNGKYLLFTSMNLYEFSQKHNREMGILFRRVNEEQENIFGRDDEKIFQDAIQEIDSIITSSTFEKESFQTKSNGFDLTIIKSKKDLAQEKCNLLNKFSKNKKFAVFQQGEDWLCRCDNFIDDIDVIIENNRISLNLNFEDDRKLELYESLKTNNYNKFQDYRIINCFRLFWTFYKSSPTLYPYVEHSIWKNSFESEKFLEGYIYGLNEFFKILIIEIKKTKK